MMKKKSLFLLPVLLASCCQNTVSYPCNEQPARPCAVVDETYVHKYGFEVAPDEWENRGEHGQKIRTLNNGVTATENYSFGNLDGETTYSFPYSSQVEKAYRYNRGQLVSEEERFLGGTPKQRIEHVSPSQKKITLWYESGVPQAVEVYEGNMLASGEYYNLSHQIESQVVDGNGTRTNRNSLGELESKDMIESGEMLEKTSFYPNGTPKEMLPFRHNIVHGLRRTFLNGGEPKTVEEWQNGQQTGITVVYQNGEKYAEIPYQNGLRNGIEKRYIDGRELFEEVTWVDGYESGLPRTFKVKRR